MLNSRKNNIVMILNTHVQKEQHSYDAEAEHACTERTTCMVMMLSMKKCRKNHIFMILNTHAQKVCTTHPTVLRTDIVIIQQSSFKWSRPASFPSSNLKENFHQNDYNYKSYKFANVHDVMLREQYHENCIVNLGLLWTAYIAFTKDRGDVFFSKGKHEGGIYILCTAWCGTPHACICKRDSMLMQAGRHVQIKTNVVVVIFEKKACFLNVFQFGSTRPWTLAF